MNKQQLSSKVWKIANSMRTNGIKANEYKDLILGFIFYKFILDNEVKYVVKNNGVEASVELIQDILSDQVIWKLTNKLNALIEKYSFTFNVLEKDIQKTQNELCEMLADLNGNEFDTKALAELQKILKDKKWQIINHY